MGSLPLTSRFVEEDTYRRTRLPVSLASTLDPDAYRSDEYHAIERDRAFRSSWVAICPSSDLASPGATLALDVAGRSIIAVRDGATLRAFQNVCRHRGARLLDHGACTLERYVKCPYHSWAYGLDGRLLGTPLFTDDSPIPPDGRAAFDMSDVRAFDKADYGLLPVRIAEWGSIVFACLDDSAPDLGDALGDLPARFSGYPMDDWVVARRKTYEIAANWKLIAENYMEYYHLPWVHPGLVQVSPMKDHYRWQGPGLYTGMCTTPIQPNTDAGGWHGLEPAPGVDGDDAVSGRFVWLFPNASISVLPNHVFLMLAAPDRPGRTVEQTYVLVHRSAVDDPGAQPAIDALLAFWDDVNREDITIVERVQAGIETTDYPGGRMCYRFEEPVHRFQNMVADRMVGLRRVPPGDAVEGERMFRVGS